MADSYRGLCMSFHGVDGTEGVWSTDMYDNWSDAAERVEIHNSIDYPGHEAYVDQIAESPWGQGDDEEPTNPDMWDPINDPPL